LIITPFGAITQTFEVGTWKFEIDFSADVEALAYGKNGFVLSAGASTTEISGAFSATLAAPDSGPAFVLGSPTGSRLEIGGAAFKVATALSEASQSLAISGDVSKSAVVIAPSDVDGFLSSFLPADGLRTKFDLGLAWSTERGLTFRGAAGLDATLAVGLSSGDVLSVPTLHLGLHASDAALQGRSVGESRAVDRAGPGGC
jgi:hypothetical protein